MLRFNRLMAILMTIVMLGSMLPLEAKSKKGDRYLAEGRAHEEKKEWDAALECYEKALSEDPGELVYQMAAQKARFEGSAWHITNGTKIRASGQLGEALLEFQKAYALSPSSSVAEQEILRTQDMIQRERRRVAETGAAASPEVRGMTPSQVANKEAEDRVDRLLPLPELRPLRPALQDFTMNNQTPKVLFDTLALNAGLNILYDPEYLTAGPKEKQTVKFTNSTVEEALQYLAMLTKSYWKPINANTIFVTMDNPNKRRDYEDEVTKIFYLRNTTLASDITAMVTAIRTVADVQRLYPFESQNAIVAKGTADKMALAEKIVHDLDKPRPEVVVDIFVLEGSSIYMRSLAAGPFATGVNLQAGFTPRASIQVQQSATTATTSSTTTSTSTTSTTTPTTGVVGTTSSTTASLVPFSALGQVNANDWSTTLPSAVFTATLSDTRTRVLQSPQLRAVDGVKATMKIGEREPFASGSFQPGLGGVTGAGISPLVNTQFQYQDIGVNVEITPKVHENGDVSLIVALDISSITGTSNLGGINEPIVGQRKVEQSIRLREGEVSLLGGLLSTQDNKSKTGVPGLASLPIIGKLFSGDSVDRERDEVMIALIPHVVRRPDITPENVRGVDSGPLNTTIVRRSPKPIEEEFTKPQPHAPAPAAEAPKPAAQPAPAPGIAVVVPPPPPPVAQPAAIPPPVVPPAGPPGILPPATAPPETPAGTTPAPPAAAPVAAAPAAAARPTGPVRIQFPQDRLDKTVGQSFTVTVEVENAHDVVSAPFTFQYDPKLLSLDQVAYGDFWTSDGQEPQPLVKNVQNDAGMASIRVSRKAGSPALAGKGTLLTLTFKALASGTGTISASNITLNNIQDQMVGSGSPRLTIDIK
jgi:general secretion pathway protein D